MSQDRTDRTNGPDDTLAASFKPLIAHSQPYWRSRAATLGLLLLAIFLFGAPALAQDAAPAVDAGATPATTEVPSVPRSAWVLPIRDLMRLEPVTTTIVLGSVIAITLIIQAILRVRRNVLLPPETNTEIERLIQGKQYRELIEFTDKDDAFVSQALHPALKRAPSFSDMQEALEAGVADQTAEEFRRLEYINILANVGPLLGLLGTVIGIMNAFLAMQRAGGSADVNQLAAGISTALGTTMLGLLLAIPCLVSYGVLRNRVDRLTTEGAIMAEEFLLMIKPDNKGNTPAPNSANPSPAPVAPRAPAPRPYPAQAPARQTAPAQ